MTQEPKVPMIDIPNVWILIVVVLLAMQLFMSSIIAIRLLGIHDLIKQEQVKGVG